MGRHFVQSLCQEKLSPTPSYTNVSLFHPLLSGSRPSCICALTLHPLSVANTITVEVRYWTVLRLSPLLALQTPCALIHMYVHNCNPLWQCVSNMSDSDTVLTKGYCSSSSIFSMVALDFSSTQLSSDQPCKQNMSNHHSHSKLQHAKSWHL